MALFALLGFAIAQPLLSTPATAAFHGGGPRGVVLVLDDSASMGYTEDGVTLLDRARAAARKVVEELRPGDSASIVLAGHRADGPQEVFPAADDAAGRRAPGARRREADGTERRLDRGHPDRGGAGPRRPGGGP